MLHYALRTTHYALRTTHYALILSLLLPIVGFGQCPTTPITLSSQAEVDAFTTTYPGCAELQNSLTISGSDISDLTPLSGITSIHSLKILDNSILENLDGLGTITNIAGYSEGNFEPLEIWNNPSLLDISALINASNSEIFEGVSVRDNPLLTTLHGLQGLNNFIWFFSIDNNDSLVNLSGLNNITGTDDAQIYNNDNLINLVGLDSHNGGGIIIANNQSLENIVGLNTPWSIVLSNNPNLQNIDGIQGAITLYQLHLIGNNSLVDISDLNSVVNFQDNISVLRIEENINLSMCHIESVCSLISACNGSAVDCDYISIINNGQDCESIAQVGYFCGTPPFNDDCQDATEVSLGETIHAYNEMATTSSNVPSCNNEPNRIDVWFRFNSGSTTSVDISVNAGYHVQLWEGLCAGMTHVPDGCGTQNLYDISISPDTDYSIQVWSYDTGRMLTGLFDLLVQDATLSLNDTEIEGFSMFPNPANHQVAIQASNIIDQVVVYDLLGKRLLERGVQDSSLVLDVSQFSKGVYLVKVVSGSRKAVRKLVVD